MKQMLTMTMVVLRQCHHEVHWQSLDQPLMMLTLWRMRTALDHRQTHQSCCRSRTALWMMTLRVSLASAALCSEQREEEAAASDGDLLAL